MQVEKHDNLKSFAISMSSARKAANLTQEQLADAVGVGKSTLASWEIGRNMPRMTKLAKLKQVLGVDFSHFLGIKSENSPLLLKIETASNARMAPVENGLRLIPVISHMRAGHGCLDDLTSNYDDLEHQIDERIESDCKDPNAFALIVEGDSMEPRFLAGDRVIFAPNETPRSGDFVVARIFETGQVLFKKFKQVGRNGESVLLESLNPAYDPIELARSVFRFIFPAVDLKSKLRR